MCLEVVMKARKRTDDININTRASTGIISVSEGECAV